MEEVVGVGGLEPPAPASQTRCAANCATPRQHEYNSEYGEPSRHVVDENDQISLVIGTFAHIGGLSAVNRPDVSSNNTTRPPDSDRAEGIRHSNAYIGGFGGKVLRADMR
jgi:hypothetical protein